MPFVNRAGYKQRVLGAPRTIVTTLFGVGWPARHRVVPNRATERWCDADGREPRWIARLQRVVSPLAARLPPRPAIAHAQRLWLPLFSPLPARAGMDDAALDVTPLYAGEAVRSIDRVIPAAEAVALLAA